MHSVSVSRYLLNYMLKTGQPLDFSFSERSNKQAAATSDIQTKANSLFNSLNTPDLKVQSSNYRPPATNNVKTKILYKPQPMQVIFEQPDAPQNSEGPSAIKRSWKDMGQDLQIKNPSVRQPSEIILSPGSKITVNGSGVRNSDTAQKIKKQLSALREKSIVLNKVEQLPARTVVSEAVAIQAPQTTNIFQSIPNRIRFDAVASPPLSSREQEPAYLPKSSPIYKMSQALNIQNRDSRPKTPNFVSQPVLNASSGKQVVRKSAIIEHRPVKKPLPIVYDQEVVGGHGYAGYIKGLTESTQRKPEVLHTTTTAESVQKLPSQTQRAAAPDKMRVSYPREVRTEPTFLQKFFCCKRAHSPSNGENW